MLWFDFFECEEKNTDLVEFCLKNRQFQPISNLFFQIRWNLITTTDKAIETKQNSCKILAEQMISNAEKCHLWQHDPGIVASLFKSNQK